MSEGRRDETDKTQVCKVSKTLLSVKRVLQAGNRVVFDETGSYIEAEVSEESMHLHEEGSMYMLKLREGGLERRPASSSSRMQADRKTSTNETRHPPVFISDHSI